MNVDPGKVAAFVGSLEEYQPTVPDELTQHLLRTSGHECADPRLVRLISLAAQVFATDVLADALEIHRRRKAALGNKARYGDHGLVYERDRNRSVLTSEDLAASLEEYGVSLRQPMYYANAGGGPPGGLAQQQQRR